MREITSIETLRAQLANARADGKRIGLVPTMGFLHAGHLSLVDAARRESDVVVMSIFVNPLQFAPGEDFDRYPRDLEHDRTLAAAQGVDLLFRAVRSEMYRTESDLRIGAGAAGARAWGGRGSARSFRRRAHRGRETVQHRAAGSSPALARKTSSR